MSPEMLAIQLGSAYARADQTLDELLVVVATLTPGADYFAVWSDLAARLRDSRADGLADVLAAALLRLLAAAQNRDLAAEEIARLNARIELAAAHTTGATNA
ncbi:hypothetical protein [Nocardia cyriacigeorgica]|uniref:hypothetical protein n=1 Tax=Nocardia cyriacigeorgica TaxID=135487 RepID=UPI002456E2D3|nr:hypothetical protein [Nocardia cyriacigeorgica]